MAGIWRITAALGLAGCMAAVPDRPIAVTHLRPTQAAPAGSCWASDTTPAVIETVTEHSQIRPAQRDGAGNILAEAEFQTTTAQRLVQDRETVWFPAPCPAQMTVTFIASLQRALKARGLYIGAVTGEFDAATGEALRQFQAERGLDSAVLSLGAARALGLAISPI